LLKVKLACIAKWCVSIVSSATHYHSFRKLCQTVPVQVFCRFVGTSMNPVSY